MKPVSRKARALLRRAASHVIKHGPAKPSGTRKATTGARFNGPTPKAKPAPQETRFHRPWNKGKPVKVKSKFVGGKGHSSSALSSIRGKPGKVPRKALVKVKAEYADRRKASIKTAKTRVSKTKKAVGGAMKWTGKKEHPAMRKSAADVVRRARTTTTGKHKGKSVRGTKSVANAGLRHFRRTSGPVKGGITFQGRHYESYVPTKPVKHGRIIGVGKKGGKFHAKVKGRIGDEKGLNARLASDKLSGK